MQQSHRFVLVDVFTDTPLAGNPLAVFTDARGMSEGTMLALTREFHFSECVFLLPATEKGAQATLRIFTPQGEVPFAGHPVLGAAFVLGTTVQLDAVTFQTGRGAVPVSLEREGARVVFGWMRQPLPTIRTLPSEDGAALAEALGIKVPSSAITLYDNGILHAMVPLDSREQVAALQPDAQRLLKFPFDVSTFAGEGEKWKTRVFSGWAGIPEDPATGSAAGPLALHLVRSSRLALERTIEVEQGAEVGRPSLLFARVHGSGDGADLHVTGLEVGGQAVVLGRGEFRL